MVLKFTCCPTCPPDRGILLLSRGLNLKMEINKIDVLVNSPKGYSLKPYKRRGLPVLEEGGFTLRNCQTIAEYLVKKHGKDSPIYPKSPSEEAKIQEKLHFNSSVLIPKTFEAITPILFQKKTGITKSAKHGIKEAYKHLESFLKNSPWLAGDFLSAADYCNIASITTLDLVAPVYRDKYPKLYEYMENCRTLPSYRDINDEEINKLATLMVNKLTANQRPKAKKQTV